MTRSPLTLLAALLLLTPLLLTACHGHDEAHDTSDDGDTHLDNMAREHAGEEPTPSPAVEPEPAAPVTAEEVAYATVAGEPVRGYLAVPETGDPKAGLIVIHEWWGLNDNIRAMARRLAGEGYAALAVDLYAGESADTPEKARELAGAARQNTGPVEDNLRQARAFLGDSVGVSKVGTIGWCFGGGWSLQTALLMPDQIDATVIYYGRVTDDKDTLQALNAPILGLFGAEDQGIPVESVRAFEAALQDLGKPATLQIYEGANHAFANPSGERFNADAAEDAWKRTLAFFGEHL